MTKQNFALLLFLIALICVQPFRANANENNGHPAIMPADERIECETGKHQVFKALTEKAKALHFTNTLDNLYALRNAINSLPRKDQAMYERTKGNLRVQIPEIEDALYNNDLLPAVPHMSRFFRRKTIRWLARAS